MATKLVFVNVVAFVVTSLVGVVFFMGGGETAFLDYTSGYLRYWTYLPTDLHQLLIRPWTLVTSMFMHSGFMHIFGNMLMLYFFGSLAHTFLNNRQVLVLYLTGGFFGAFATIAAFNLLPGLHNMVGTPMVGASAAVMAVLLCTTALAPDMPVQLFLSIIRPFPLKYLALFLVALDILSMPSSNTGGRIAHLGGALWGWFYAMQFRQGNDLSKPFGQFWQKINDLASGKKRSSGPTPLRNPNTSTARPTSNPSPARPVPPRTPSQGSGQDTQARVDAILEKIKQSGYDSLTKEEKEFLFKASGN